MLRHPIPLIALITVMTGVTSCATYDPSEYYDKDAAEKLGRVVGKGVAKAELRPTAEVRSPLFVPVIIGGIATVLAAPRPITQRDMTEIPVYEYVVRTSDNQLIRVYSEYSAFDVGSCVKVFLSDKPSYPRIAIGSDCDT